MIRQLLFILNILLISLASPLAGASIEYIKGDVFLVRDTAIIPIRDTGTIEIKKKDAIYVSDTGMAIVYFEPVKLYIYMDTRTKIKFLRVPRSPREFIFLYMKFGNAWFKFGKVILQKDVLIRTYFADFYPRSHDFHIFSDHIGTRVAVFQGTGIFGMKKSEEIICNVTKGKYAEIYKGQLKYPRKFTPDLKNFYTFFRKKFKKTK